MLKAFFLNPTRDFYQRELTALTGERLFLIQTALKRLQQAGVVDLVPRGNRTYYRVNHSHPAYESLKALILKTVGLGDSLRDQIQHLGDRIKVAFVYGSVARGEETASSDIDFMLIGDLTSREAAASFAGFRRESKREVNLSVYRPAEFREKFWDRHPFIREVVNRPRIFIVGDQRELQRVLGRRPT